MGPPKPPRHQGTIIRLQIDKGYGFIRNHDNEDYFFHRSACDGFEFNDAKEKQAVTFEPSEGPKGPRAENVRLQYGNTL